MTQNSVQVPFLNVHKWFPSFRGKCTTIFHTLTDRLMHFFCYTSLADFLEISHFGSRPIPHTEWKSAHVVKSVHTKSGQCENGDTVSSDRSESLHCSYSTHVSIYLSHLCESFRTQVAFTLITDATVSIKTFGFVILFLEHSLLGYIHIDYSFIHYGLCKIHTIEVVQKLWSSCNHMQTKCQLWNTCIHQSNYY